MNHKQKRLDDGSYLYRYHHIKKRIELGTTKEKWFYVDIRSKLWHKSSTLKEAKRNIDRFIEYYNKINNLTEQLEENNG